RVSPRGCPHRLCRRRTAGTWRAGRVRISVTGRGVARAGRRHRLADRDVGSRRRRRRHHLDSARRARRSHRRGDPRRPSRAPTAAAIVADGHALAVRGEGRYAAGAAISASVMGALFGMGVLVAFIPLAPRVLAQVGSPELAALAIVGICLLVPLSHADPVKGLFSSALGLALATVGLDPFRAEPRFTFAQLSLLDGLRLLPVALGLFPLASAPPII